MLRHLMTFCMTIVTALCITMLLLDIYSPSPNNGTPYQLGCDILALMGIVCLWPLSRRLTR